MQMIHSVLIALLVVSACYAGTCPADGVWPEIRESTHVVVPCPAGTLGPMSRFCRRINDTLATWDEPEMQHCLSITPEPGMGFVDFTFNISESRVRFITPRPKGVLEGISIAYHLEQSAISIHRIADEGDMHTSVQVRVTLPIDEAKKFYETINKKDDANEVGVYLSKNNNVEKRYQYLTFKGEMKCVITYIGERVLHVTPIKENKFLNYIMEHLLWIIISTVEVIIIIVILSVKKHNDDVAKRPLV